MTGAREKKKSIPCNGICKKMGFASNLTVREQKHEHNTFATWIFFSIETQLFSKVVCIPVFEPGQAAG